MLQKHFHKFISLILLGMFLYTCIFSIEKYNAKMTTVNIREAHQELQQYPSVTVCPSLAIKSENMDRKTSLILFPSKLTSFSPEKFLETLRVSYKNMNDTFYFVNQKTLSNSGFPCMTKKNSFDPGKPCHFPYKKR